MVSLKKGTVGLLINMRFTIVDDSKHIQTTYGKTIQI